MNSESGNAPEVTDSDDWLTIPNLVTFVRFLLVPVFVWLMFHDEYWDALITLIVLFSTDWIDGFLARKLNQVSAVGKWLDPLADRLSLWVVIITIVLSGLAPLWLVFALVVPDLVLAGLMLTVYA
ncbi:MAG: CDP-alcohol phosphatidyltransferase family protein, partial [Yaniella sp.]|nr:CDP-alcohol phosphatidyltransferase family protein [Yaniella sp.]